jgi:hypothetical protein
MSEINCGIYKNCLNFEQHFCLSVCLNNVYFLKCGPGNLALPINKADTFQFEYNIVEITRKLLLN